MIYKQLGHTELNSLRFGIATHSTDSRDAPEEEGDTLLGAVSARESRMGPPAGTMRPQSVEQCLGQRGGGSV